MSNLIVTHWRKPKSKAQMVLADATTYRPLAYCEATVPIARQVWLASVILLIFIVAKATSCMFAKKVDIEYVRLNKIADHFVLS